MREVLSILFVAALFIGIGPGATPAYAQASDGGEAATKQNLDLPFDAVGQDEDPEEAPDVIIFMGQRYEGDFFCFVADKSSSMNGAPWLKVQREVVKIVQGFSERVQFGIVFFDANQVKFPQSGRPADATQAMKGAAMSMVMTTKTGHGSCYKEALKTALIYSQQSTAKRKTIILLGDGVASCDGDVAGYSKATLAMTASMNTQRAHINTIWIGKPDNVSGKPFLQQIAAQNAGTYKEVNDV